MEIDVENIATAHEMVVAKIMKTCREVDIETSPGKWEKTWEYPDAVMTIIRRPQQLPQVSEACSFGPGFIAQYKDDLCHLKLRNQYPEGEAPVYTYPWRLMDHPIVVEEPNPCPGGRKFSIRGNGDGRGINQIDQIVKRLLDSQESRRANAVTWVPEIDGNATHDQPCLQVAHFLVRDGIDDPKCPKEDENTLYLHGRFFFRSHDMLGGAGANWVGLCGLMEMIAGRLKYLAGDEKNIGPGEVGVKVGSLTTCSSSAHLYWKRDESDLDKFRAYLFKKYRMYL
jgi:thymidylate synthase